MRALVAASLLGLSMLGGCAQPQNILSEGPPISDRTAEGVVHQVQPVYGQGAPAVILSSDNKSIVRRSGLNSDANNPSGMPGRPVAWYEI